MADADNIVSGMAGRYASALFALAKDSNSTDAVAADLKRFADLVAGDPNLQLLVRSPAFSAEDQTRALGKILEAVGIGGLAAKFLRLVASKRRLFGVTRMIADFNALNDASRGVRRAEVTVAEALSPGDAEALKQALGEGVEGRTVEVDIKVDPDIIGGLVVRLGSRMVDSSLRTKLNSIRTRMKEVG